MPPTNVIFKKSCSYQHMLEHCISMLKYDKKDCEFYLADSKGVPIWTANMISMDGEGEIPWTRHSNIRYRSKAKLYCVKKVSTLEYMNVIQIAWDQSLFGLTD